MAGSLGDWLDVPNARVEAEPLSLRQRPGGDLEVAERGMGLRVEAAAEPRFAADIGELDVEGEGGRGLEIDAEELEVGRPARAQRGPLSRAGDVGRRAWLALDVAELDVGEDLHRWPDSDVDDRQEPAPMFNIDVGTHLPLCERNEDRALRLLELTCTLLDRSAREERQSERCQRQEDGRDPGRVDVPIEVKSEKRRTHIQTICRGPDG